MEKYRVYAASCPDYGQAEETVRALVGRMGGMERFVKPGERILLKPNLLRPAPPESAICTHPAVVEAVAKLVAEAGGQAVIADSPGGALQREGVLRALYEKTGMAAAAERAGAQVCTDPAVRRVALPRGRVLRQAEVTAPAAEADGAIDLCKMKTHVLMGMTGAVKNCFGIIPGLSKVGFHSSHPNQAQFADVVLDLTEYLSPRLCLMDGVLAMEGNGPGASGTPRQVGLLLAADSALALDVAAAAAMGLPEEANPVLQAARRRGLSPARTEEIELAGTSWEALRIPDFRLPSNVKQDLMDFLGPLAGLGRRLSNAALVQTPRIDPARCVGCGVCRDACPGRAISMSGPRATAKVDRRACIRCYCCHELCPRQAVELKGSWLRKLLR